MRRISTVFFRYACFYTAGVLFWIFFLFVFWYVLDVTGRVLPANHMEVELNEAAGGIRKVSKVTEELLPEGCLYGVYGSDGSWLYGTLSGKEISEAWENYERGSIYGRKRGYYRFIALDSQEICIVKYEIAPRFENEVLEKYLPNPDVLLVLSFIVLFLIHTVLVSRYFGKYMKKKLLVLSEVTARIRDHDLEFEEEHSELKEVEEVLISLNQMKEALKESLYRQWNLEKSREEQITALAHDIKTPLTVIRGNAELLAEGGLTEEEQEYDRDILRSVSMMEEYLALLNELLSEDMKQEESGRYNEKSCDGLADLITEQARLLASAKQRTVIFHRKELYGTLRCDEHQILRAFHNILGNAVEYSPPNGRIEISMEMREKEEGDYLAVSVADEGPGFTMQDLEHAAEQFYQGDQSRSSKNHHGIGLYTAERFVKAQGGCLVIENTVTHGARVSMMLRIHKTGTAPDDQ